MKLFIALLCLILLSKFISATYENQRYGLMANHQNEGSKSKNATKWSYHENNNKQQKYDDDQSEWVKIVQHISTKDKSKSDDLKSYSDSKDRVYQDSKKIDKKWTSESHQNDWSSHHNDDDHDDHHGGHGEHGGHGGHGGHDSHGGHHWGHKSWKWSPWSHHKKGWKWNSWHDHDGKWGCDHDSHHWSGKKHWGWDWDHHGGHVNHATCKIICWPHHKGHHWDHHDDGKHDW